MHTLYIDIGRFGYLGGRHKLYNSLVITYFSVLTDGWSCASSVRRSQDLYCPCRTPAASSRLGSARFGSTLRRTVEDRWAIDVYICFYVLVMYNWDL
jgi:hypothetical protein